LQDQPDGAAPFLIVGRRPEPPVARGVISPGAVGHAHRELLPVMPEDQDQRSLIPHAASMPDARRTLTSRSSSRCVRARDGVSSRNAP